MRPASTKLPVITVVALLLWMSMVTRVPISTPRSGVRVSMPTRCRSRSPATSWRESLMSFMEYRKMPTPPKS